MSEDALGQRPSKLVSDPPMMGSVFDRKLTKENFEFVIAFLKIRQIHKKSEERKIIAH